MDRKDFDPDTVIEVRATANLLAEEYSAHKRKFARTVVTDLGSWFRRDGLYVNQCGLLCVWWALAIQRELGLCKEPIRGINDRIFGTVADLYDDLQYHLAEYSVEMRGKCRSSKHQSSGCAACTHTFTPQGNLNRDYFAILANMIGRAIYMWDMYDGKCYKYRPNDINARPINVEAIDSNRIIMICGLHGHYELICGMFKMRNGNYDHVEAAMVRIANEELYDRRGVLVQVNPPVLPHSLDAVTPESRSFMVFPRGVMEPILYRVNLLTARDEEIAVQLHNELNGENKL